MCNFVLEPQVFYLGEAPILKINDLPANCQVVLKVTLTEPCGRIWTTQAAYCTDEQGQLDLEDALPMGGKFAAKGTAGLLWSCEPENPKSGTVLLELPREPVAVLLEVVGEQGSFGSLETEWKLPHTPLVERHNTFGNLPSIEAYPAEAPEQLPGVLLLYGDHTPSQWEGVKMLAQRGFWVAGVQVYEGSPKGVSLSIIDKAIDWMHNQFRNLTSITVVGSGRTGEMILARLSQEKRLAIDAAVSFSGSGIVFSHPDEPSWVFKGETVSSAWVDTPDLDSGKTFRMRPYFEEAVRDRENRNRGRCQLDNITVPILLISGQDDQFWPASAFSELLVQQAKKNKQTNIVHYTYESAGHLLGFDGGIPYRPSVLNLAVLGEGLCDYGGRGSLQAHAQKEAWEQFLQFLRTVESDG